MTEYKLTKKGLVFFSVFTIVMILGIITSAHNIFEYVFKVPNATTDLNTTSIETKDDDINLEKQNVTSETSETTDVIGTNEALKTTETIETTESSNQNLESIYSKVDLEELRQFKITFFFDMKEDQIVLEKVGVNAIVSEINKFPNEQIAIVGYVNGFPEFKNSENNKELSKTYATFVLNKFKALDLDEKYFTVYGLGTDNPLSIESHKQNMNTRVEVYFLDHYLGMKHAK